MDLVLTADRIFRLGFRRPGGEEESCEEAEVEGVTSSDRKCIQRRMDAMTSSMLNGEEEDGRQETLHSTERRVLQ